MPCSQASARTLAFHPSQVASATVVTTAPFVCSASSEGQPCVRVSVSAGVSVLVAGLTIQGSKLMVGNCATMRTVSTLKWTMRRKVGIRSWG